MAPEHCFFSIIAWLIYISNSLYLNSQLQVRAAVKVKKNLIAPKIAIRERVQPFPEAVKSPERNQGSEEDARRVQKTTRYWSIRYVTLKVVLSLDILVGRGAARQKT